MSEGVDLETYKRAQREVGVEKEERAFRNHAIVYVLVNAALVAWNFLSDPGTLWFYWPLAGWGLGLAFHYFMGVRSAEEEILQEQAIIEDRARESSR